MTRGGARCSTRGRTRVIVISTGSHPAEAMPLRRLPRPGTIPLDAVPALQRRGIDSPVQGGGTQAKTGVPSVATTHPLEAFSLRELEAGLAHAVVSQRDGELTA